MAEYIARDKLWDTFVDEPFYDNADKDEIVLPIIDSFPAADVAPVVHGRWLKYYRSGVTVAEGCVSSCCDMWNERETHYCPNCGAKMDGGADDAAD